MRISQAQHVLLAADAPGIWIAKFRGDAGERLQKALGERSEHFGFDEAKQAAEACFNDWQSMVPNQVRGDGAATVAGACRLYVRSLRIEGREAAAHASTM